MEAAIKCSDALLDKLGMSGSSSVITEKPGFIEVKILDEDGDMFITTRCPTGNVN